MADKQERRQPGARRVAQFCMMVLVAITTAEARGVDLAPQQRSCPAGAGGLEAVGSAPSWANGAAPARAIVANGDARAAPADGAGAARAAAREAAAAAAGVCGLCSGHGYDAGNACTCNDAQYAFAADCSLTSCPNGNAWANTGRVGGSSSLGEIGRASCRERV